MKRRREMENVSEIRAVIEELSVMVTKTKPVVVVDKEDQHVPIKPFLLVCNLVLQVLDKIGPTMAVLRQDINQNMQRLEKFCETDPALYSDVVEILKKEASEGNARKLNSCSRAFVWLTRSLDFTVTLLQVVIKDFGINMEQAVEESYSKTLKPWHGWISSTAYRVALKLVPDNKTFTSILMKKEEDEEILKDEIETLTSLLAPNLEEISSVVRTYGLDKMKAP